MKKIKSLTCLFLVIILVFLTLGLCSCDYFVEDEPFDGYTNVKNVEYDMNFISIDKAKSLFASSFSPLMPSYDFLKDSKYHSMLKSGTMGDALLETKYNYYLSINNPSKKYLSERDIYEAYTLSIATPIVWDEPEFYGLEADDLLGFNHKPVWFDYDYFYEKLGESVDRETNAQALADYCAMSNFALESNEMPKYYIFKPTMSRVSFITFNAYSDTIKQDYANHKYPRNLEIINSNDSNVRSVEVNFNYSAININVHIIEKKKVCDVYMQFTDILFPEGVDDSEWFYSYEGGCYIETMCSADFTLDNINYTITYPLMNRLTTYNSTDFGSAESSDYLKLVEITQKSISHFIQDFLK